MTEKDFVMAWLLAARAGSDAISFSDSRLATHVNQAQEIYKQLEEGYHDTDNGVSDL
jgi:hypothetical protein